MSSENVGLSNHQIAAEIAYDLAEGMYVNLGIGLPQLVSEHVAEDKEVVFHSENGVLGVGPAADADHPDWDLIDAGKSPVTLLPGGSYMSHADSFSLIRGGHLDACVLGAFEVSASGDLANWWTGSGMPGVGGAMDLCSGAKSVRVMTKHQTKRGLPKLTASCSMPLTGTGVVDRVYTDLGIFVPRGDHFEVLALASGVALESVQVRTGAPVEAGGRIAILPRSAP